MQRSASILSRCRVLWGHVALGQDHRLAASVAASGHPPGCNTLRRFSLSTSDPTPGGGNDGNNSSNTSSSPSNTETTNTPSAAPQQQEQPAATGSPEAPSPRRPIVPVASAAVQALAEQLQQSSAASGSLAELFPQQQLLQQQPGGRAGRQRQQAGAADATAPAAAGSSQPALSATTNVVDVIMMAVENCRPLMTVQQSKAGTRVGSWGWQDGSRSVVGVPEAECRPDRSMTAEWLPPHFGGLGCWACTACTAWQGHERDATVVIGRAVV